MAYRDFTSSFWEVAKSDKSECKNIECNRKIPKGNMRLGVWTDYNGQKRGITYFCVPCAREQLEKQIELLQKIIGEAKKW